MRKINTKKNQINESYLEQVGLRAFTPSSLLVPKHRHDFFLMRKKQFNGITNYFMYLLVSYVRNLSDFGIFPRHTTSKWKKQYQKSGRQLKKVSFVPDPCIWEAYRQVADQYGVSICHLFVIVMRLDWYEWLMAECPEEIPTMPVKHKFRNSLIKCPKKLTDFNYTTYSSQEIDFHKETFQRQGYFRKLRT